MIDVAFVGSGAALPGAQLVLICDDGHRIDVAAFERFRDLPRRSHRGLLGRPQPPSLAGCELHNQTMTITFAED